MLDEALDHLVRGIVTHPDEVQVQERNRRRGPVLEVRVHPDDLGKVIGRAGRTATAIRTVINGLSSNTGSGGIRVDFLDVDEGR